MTIDKNSLNRADLDALREACQAPTTKISDMNARIKCVTALIDQEIKDYTAVCARLAPNQARTAEFKDAVITRLGELLALRDVFKATLKDINSDEAIKAGGKDLKILHQQSLINVAFNELQSGVMLRGLSAWHNDELWYDNTSYNARPDIEQLNAVIWAYDCNYVRAVAFRMYA